MRTRAASVLAAAAAVAVSLVAGCTDDQPAGPKAIPAATGDGLTIWVDGARADALRPYAERFGKSHRVRVQVQQTPAALPGALADAAGSGTVPDIVAGTHDLIGALVRDGLIDTVPLTSVQRGKFAGAAVNAVKHDGRTYGVPFAIESVALIRNIELAPDPPRTIEEAIAIGNQLKRAGRVSEPIAYPVGEHGDWYHLYPLYVSAGGSLVPQREGAGVDLKDLGLAKPEAVQAFARIGRLGEKGSGGLKRAIGADTAVSLFVAGKTPFLVAGPEAFAEIKRSGLGHDITGVPMFNNGKPASSLIKVSAFFVTQQSRSKRLAREFLTSVGTRADVAAALYEADPRPPALKDGFNLVRSKDPDADVQKFFDTGRGGVLVPPVPEMASVWGPFAQVEADVVAGGDASVAVQAAVRTITNSLQ